LNDVIPFDCHHQTKRYRHHCAHWRRVDRRGILDTSPLPHPASPVASRKLANLRYTLTLHNYGSCQRNCNRYRFLVSGVI